MNPNGTNNGKADLCQRSYVYSTLIITEQNFHNPVEAISISISTVARVCVRVRVCVGACVGACVCVREQARVFAFVHGANFPINPFTAPACTISGLKSAHIHA